MADPDRLQSVVTAAERAAAAKDFAAAGRLLREAVQLQEADLGPDHPDLANTLNNLGVVCEMADQPSEAEACYRRAYAIAAAALPPDHPFVTTSRENLTEFCKARGKPLDPLLPVHPAASTPPLEQRPTEPTPAVETAPVAEIPGGVEKTARVQRPSVARSPQVDTPARVSGGISSRLAFAIVGVIVLMVGFIVVRRSADRGRSPSDTATPTNVLTSPHEPPAAPAPSALPGTPPPVASSADPKPSAAKPVPPARGDDTLERGSRANRRAAPGPVVVTALLCQRFAARGAPDWQCEPPRGAVGHGTLVFYTRIRAARPTTVQHRWYRGNELHQSVSLDVSANQVAGYRTYSRYTVPRSGAWRVELRTRDGALLHEERFEVR